MTPTMVLSIPARRARKVWHACHGVPEASIIKAWKEGLTGVQIATRFNVPTAQIAPYIASLRKRLGTDAIPRRNQCHGMSPLPRVLKSGPRINVPRERWLEIAQLWRDGLRGEKLGAALGVMSGQATVLVQRARWHLGKELVPNVARGRYPKRAAQPAGPITMTDAGRHYLRRVGPEYVFRTEDGREEVWVEGEHGLLHRYRVGRISRSLLFKTVMGMTEDRVAVPVGLPCVPRQSTVHIDFTHKPLTQVHPL